MLRKTKRQAKKQQQQQIEINKRQNKKEKKIAERRDCNASQSREFSITYCREKNLYSSCHFVLKCSNHAIFHVHFIASCS